VEAARSTHKRERAFGLGTPDAIADFYNTDTSTVEEALEILAEQDHVDSIEDNGRERYYIIESEYNPKRGR
jgi:ribosomal protein S25